MAVAYQRPKLKKGVKESRSQGVRKAKGLRIQGFKGSSGKIDYLSQRPQRTQSYNIFIRTGERFVLMKQLTLRVKLLDNNVTETWFPDRGARG